jgi:uncharacterized protein DUF2829
MNYDAQNGHMDFCGALNSLRKGGLVARAGWNGKNMFLYLVRGGVFHVNRAPLQDIYDVGTVATYRDHIDMHTAQGDFVPWVATQTDILAEDWQEVILPHGATP